MSFVGSNILAGASGQGGADYKIERSLRFNSADSAYLNKLPRLQGTEKIYLEWLDQKNRIRRQ